MLNEIDDAMRASRPIVRCPNCGGSGGHESECGMCEGSGKVRARAVQLPPPENPKEITGRQKPVMATIPPVAEALQCAVHEHGHGRHGEWNWRETPINLTTYIKAIGRHLAAVLDGEWLDPDSGLPHFSHIACGTNIAIDALSIGHLINDLPPPGMGANLLAAIEATKVLPARLGQTMPASR